MKDSILKSICPSQKNSTCSLDLLPWARLVSLCRFSALALMTITEIADVVATELLFGYIEFCNFLAWKYFAVFGGVVFA